VIAIYNMASTSTLHLTPTQRGELEGYLRKRNLPASVAQRMRIVLLLDEGSSYRDIEEKLGTPNSTVSRWKQR
jgi:DNA invertase Pin-like site-specific DNA recombinase